MDVFPHQQFPLSFSVYFNYSLPVLFVLIKAANVFMFFKSSVHLSVWPDPPLMFYCPTEKIDNLNSSYILINDKKKISTFFSVSHSMISRSGNWASFPKEGAHQLRLIEQWLPGGLGSPLLVLDLVIAE